MSGNKLLSPQSVFYSLFTVVFLGLFYRSLQPEIAGSVFEQDLLWYVPNFVWQTQGLLGFALIKYLLAPSLWYMDPVTKIYFWICHALFGVQVKYYITTTLLIHLCNALLVYQLCRVVKLSFRISYLSALTTLFFFAQFHAYMWPMAFQHIIVVFFILLGFTLYLKTDDLIITNRRFSGYWTLCLLVNIAASFCRFNIIILPVMMLTHLLFCSSDDSQKIRKLKIWLPIVAVYLGNPLYSLFGAGDNRAHMDFTAYSYWQGLLAGVAILAASFYLFKGYAHFKKGLPKNFEQIFLPASVVLGGVVVFLVRGFTNSIFAVVYSLLIPLIACFKALLEPLHTAQTAPSTFAYYLIPAQASVTSFILVAACLVYFISASLKKHRALLVFFVWYLMCFVFLVHQDPIRGRYFIFLAPMFSIVFCMVIVHLADFLFSHVKSVGILRVKNSAVMLLFACLFATNISATKLALFRGKLINALNSFNYIKAATLVQFDLQKTSETGIHPGQILILNLQPVPWPKIDYKGIAAEPSDHYFNGKAIFSQTFRDDRYFGVSFQDPAPTGTPLRIYIVNSGRVERDHRPVDPFLIDFDRGKLQLTSRQFDPAQASFTKAIQHRPFLFRYLLGELEFDDLAWITGGLSVVDWFDELMRTNRIQGREVSPDMHAIFSDIQMEIDVTTECLFYLAYLEGLSGNREKELFWTRQLKILENNSEQLQTRLMTLPLVASNAALKEYANGVSESLRYKDWESHNLYYSFYLFEKFVLRLLAL